MEASELTFVGWLLYWAQWVAVPVVSITVSIVYFVAADRQLRISRRLIASMSGLSIAVIYLVAAAVALAGNASRNNATAFNVAQLIPIALILASFKLYRGPKRVHYLQIPNVLSFIWGSFIGGMAVTGVWL